MIIMTRIEKVFETETAHIVRGATSERCKFNVHGHSYKWEVEICGPVNDFGMVIDFIELKPIKEFIDLFDHAMILWSEEENSFVDFFKTNCKRVMVMKKNTTAENMARLVHKYTNEWLNHRPGGTPDTYKCTQVNVWETRTGCGIATSSDTDDIIQTVQI
jgi:6-pyruvoyltetrahydropterin/6-carboxytetrahydropterin synthase